MAGLMVGRTPEYLGKKIEAREVKMTMLAVLCLPLVMLGFTAIAVVTEPDCRRCRPAGRMALPRRCAYSSAAANNGSAFGGLTANPFWNLTLGSDGGGALLHHHPRAGHCRGRWRRRRWHRPRPARSRPTTACSSPWSAA
jgi:hypothetical protein